MAPGIDTRAELIANKEKWLTRHGFRSYVGGKQNMLGAKEKYSDAYYVGSDTTNVPYNESLTRKEQRDRFLFGHFKLT